MRQTGTSKSCFPCKQWRKIYQVYPISFQAELDYKGQIKHPEVSRLSYRRGQTPKNQPQTHWRRAGRWKETTPQNIRWAHLEQLRPSWEGWLTNKQLIYLEDPWLDDPNVGRRADERVIVCLLLVDDDDEEEVSLTGFKRSVALFGFFLRALPV